jgi:hypothetical protein
MLSSLQKPRFLQAAPEPMSEKRPQASFSNRNMDQIGTLAQAHSSPVLA